MEIKQYSVYWISRDPTVGSEVSKTRPCVILSPDEMNRFTKTVIIAPLTHTLKTYPSRVICDVKGEKGSIMLDQIQTVDRLKMGNIIGNLNANEISEIKFVINQMLC